MTFNFLVIESIGKIYIFLGHQESLSCEMVIWGILGSQYICLDLVRSDPIMTGVVSSMGQWLHSSVVACGQNPTSRCGLGSGRGSTERQ